MIIIDVAEARDAASVAPDLLVYNAFLDDVSRANLLSACVLVDLATHNLGLQTLAVAQAAIEKAFQVEIDELVDYNTAREREDSTSSRSVRSTRSVRSSQSISSRFTRSTRLESAAATATASSTREDGPVEYISSVHQLRGSTAVVSMLKVLLTILANDYVLRLDVTARRAPSLGSYSGDSSLGSVDSLLSSAGQAGAGGGASKGNEGGRAAGRRGGRSFFGFMRRKLWGRKSKKTKAQVGTEKEKHNGKTAGTGGTAGRARETGPKQRDGEAPTLSTTTLSPPRAQHRSTPSRASRLSSQVTLTSFRDDGNDDDGRDDGGGGGETDGGGDGARIGGAPSVFSVAMHHSIRWFLLGVGHGLSPTANLLRQLGTTRETIDDSVCTLLRLLRMLARLFPVLAPTYEWSSGMYAFVKGRPDIAKVHWHHQLAAATALGLPEQMALAHFELGRASTDFYPPASEQARTSSRRSARRTKRAFKAAAAARDLRRDHLAAARRLCAEMGAERGLATRIRRESLVQSGGDCVEFGTAALAQTEAGRPTPIYTKFGM